TERDRHAPEAHVLRQARAPLPHHRLELVTVRATVGKELDDLDAGLRLRKRSAYAHEIDSLARLRPGRKHGRPKGKSWKRAERVQYVTSLHSFSPDCAWRWKDKTWSFWFP